MQAEDPGQKPTVAQDTATPITSRQTAKAEDGQKNRSRIKRRAAIAARECLRNMHVRALSKTGAGKGRKPKK